MSLAEAALRQKRFEVADLEGQVRDQRAQLRVELSDIVKLREREAARAQADYESAKLALTVAETALKEYETGLAPMEEQSGEAAVKMAESELTRARGRSAWSADMVTKGYVTSSQHQHDIMDEQRAEFALKEAVTRIGVLRNFEKGRRLQAFQADVARAKTVLREAEQIWEEARAKVQGAQGKAGLPKQASPDDLIINLVGEAASIEGRRVKLLAELKALEAKTPGEPDAVKALADRLTAARGELATLATHARENLTLALEMGELIETRRQTLKELETKLKRERQILDRMERASAPTRPDVDPKHANGGRR